MPKVDTNRRVSQRVALESKDPDYGDYFRSQFHLARYSLPLIIFNSFIGGIPLKFSRAKQRDSYLPKPNLTKWSSPRRKLSSLLPPWYNSLFRRVKDPVFLVSETAVLRPRQGSLKVFLESSNFPAKWDTI